MDRERKKERNEETARNVAMVFLLGGKFQDWACDVFAEPWSVPPKR